MKTAYSIRKEWAGESTRLWVVRVRGEWLSGHKTKKEAKKFMRNYLMIRKM